LARLVQVIIVVGQPAHWDQTIRARLEEAHEQAEAADAADAALKAFASPAAMNRSFAARSASAARRSVIEMWVPTLSSASIVMAGEIPSDPNPSARIKARCTIRSA
jgi:multidrug efflux pump subunit AcrA (membrane-fusion protein)